MHSLETKPLKNSWFNWLLFLLICIIWGSSFILMKAGLQQLNAYQVAAIRISSGAIVLIPFAFSALKKIPASKYPIVILTGFLGTFFPAFLFCIAETRIDSAIAGILNALTPLFTLIIGVMFFSATIALKKWIGVIIGFAGLCFLLASGHEEINFGYLGYSLLVLVATILYGTNVNLINKYLKSYRSLDIAAISLPSLLIPALIVLYFTGFFSQINSSPAWIKSTSASLVLGVVGTVIGTLVFYNLIKRAGPVFSSMVTYGIPFIALGWGFLDGEVIYPVQIIYMLIILAGVFLANKK